MKNMIRLMSVVIAAMVVAAIWPTGTGADCNSSPTAVNDSASTFVEPILIDVLANDSDIDGQALFVSVTGGTCLSVGTATVDFELIRFAPDGALDADCTLVYSVTDEGGLSDQGTVTVAANVPEGLIFYDGFESGDLSAWTPCDLQCESGGKS